MFVDYVAKHNLVYLIFDFFMNCFCVLAKQININESTLFSYDALKPLYNSFRTEKLNFVLINLRFTNAQTSKKVIYFEEMETAQGNNSYETGHFQEQLLNFSFDIPN